MSDDPTYPPAADHCGHFFCRVPAAHSLTKAKWTGTNILHHLKQPHESHYQAKPLAGEAVVEVAGKLQPTTSTTTRLCFAEPVVKG